MCLFLCVLGTWCGGKAEAWEGGPAEPCLGGREGQVGVLGPGDLWLGFSLGLGRGKSSDLFGCELGAFRPGFGTTSLPITIMGLELVRAKPDSQSYGHQIEGLVSC